MALNAELKDPVRNQQINASTFRLHLTININPTCQHAPTVEFLLPSSIFSVVNGTFGSISNLQQGLGIIDCSLIAVSVGRGAEREVSGTAKR